MTPKPKPLKILAAALLLISLGQAVPVEAANPEDVKRLVETNECSECDLSGANLSFAILVNANLRGANLRGANLSNADLTKANLSQADLGQANLNQAYLMMANLDRTILTGASTKGTRGLPVIASSPPVVPLSKLKPLPPLPLPLPTVIRMIQVPVLKPKPLEISRLAPPIQPPLPMLQTTIPLRPSLLSSSPKLAEARNYFQQRWQPPSGLSQTLEYYLTLNRDGTIMRILPLGTASEKYMGYLSIPLPGEPFISPLAGRGNDKILVVLKPDGNVDVFLVE